MFPGTDSWAHHAVIHDSGPDIAHPSNTALEGSWRRAVVLGAVFPTHVMQLQPDFLWYLQISPLGTGHVRIRWDVSVAPEMLAAQSDPDEYVAKVLALLNLVNAEDQPVVEGIRRTAEAGAPVSPRPAVVSRAQCVRLRSLRRPTAESMTRTGTTGTPSL